MSLDLGLKALRLEATDRVPWTEMIDNDAVMRQFGLDSASPDDQKDLWLKLAQRMGLDFVWNQLESPMQGRFTSMGHAEWNDPWHYDNRVQCPFASEDEVLGFDPVAECRPPSHAEMVKSFQANLDHGRTVCPDVVLPGGRYHTIFSACIRTFGWDLFLASVPNHEREFDRVLEGFTEISIAEATAWAATDLPAHITHDDIVWTTGPVFSPAWYRRYVFPRYERIWRPLREKGVPVIFCADGDFSMFADDIARAGADGFIFEPVVPLDMMVERYGRTKVLMGNADCRVLMSGGRADVEREVRRCLDLGRRAPGYFLLMSNHLPNGLDPDNIRWYFDAVERLRGR